MGNQRGMSESVQWAVVGTALLIGVLGLIQASLVLHGRSVAVSAALAGAAAQAQLHAAPTSGAAAASKTAAAGGLTNVQVTVTQSSSSVTLRVEGNVQSFIAGMSPHVQAESTRPLEGR